MFLILYDRVVEQELPEIAAFEGEVIDWLGVDALICARALAVVEGIRFSCYPPVRRYGSDPTQSFKLCQKDHLTGKQSRSLANTMGPEKCRCISACVSFSLPKVRSIR